MKAYSNVRAFFGKKFVIHFGESNCLGGSHRMITNTYNEFSMLRSAEAEAAYQQEVISEGYAGFRRLLDGLTEAIKAAGDADIPGLEMTLAKASRLFPE